MFIADFEADNEKKDIVVGKRNTNIYKQNPVINGYYYISELDVLKSGYYQSPLSYNNVDWIDNQVIKLENQMAFYFKNTKKDIIMTKEVKRIIKIIIFVVFVKKKLFLKVS